MQLMPMRKDSAAAAMAARGRLLHRPRRSGHPVLLSRSALVGERYRHRTGGSRCRWTPVPQSVKPMKPVIKRAVLRAIATAHHAQETF